MLVFLSILLVAVSILLFLILLAIQAEARVSRETATHIWEYKVAPVGAWERPTEMQGKLLMEGREGWELVNVVEVSIANSTKCAGIFKRPRERGILPIPFR